MCTDIKSSNHDFFQLQRLRSERARLNRVDKNYDEEFYQAWLKNHTKGRQESVIKLGRSTDQRRRLYDCGRFNMTQDAGFLFIE